LYVHAAGNHDNGIVCPGCPMVTVLNVQTAPVLNVQAAPW
jgi:hypothetical protein